MQLAGAVVVGIVDADDREGRHADRADQRVANLPPAVLVGHALHDVFVVLRAELVHVHLAHQPAGQELAQERGVAIRLADAHQRRHAVGGPAVALALLGRRVLAAAQDVVPQLEAQVIRVDAARVRAHHLRVVDHEFHLQVGRQVQAADDAVVPEAGPALVHDLGLDLRDEVLRFLVDDGQQVPLPVGEVGIVVADEQQDVLFRLQRHAPQVRLGQLRRAVDVRVRIVRAVRGLDGPLALFGVTQFAHAKVAPAVEGQRMGCVQHRLHLVDADGRVFRIAAHAVGARLEARLRQLRVRALEGEVVLEEIVVSVDVGDGQDLQAQRVVAHQVRNRLVRVDDHLVGQAADAVVVGGLELLERLAVGPVRVVRGHAVVGHVAEHLLLVADFEHLREAVQAEFGHLFADALVPADQVIDVPATHVHLRWPVRPGPSAERLSGPARCLPCRGWSGPGSSRT
ncbi:MAG: hypothetical protein OZX49_01912 [Immundisolibacter sp.]|nr:hypothetical protein [Immundisolibacter sp.]